MDISDYDYIIVALSGGKDSVALLLRALEMIQECGAQGQLLAWHHSVDGAPHGPDGQGIHGIAPDPPLMDWPCTEDYCRKLCEHLGVPLEFSWLEGGFRREMLRDGTPKARTFFETPTGVRCSGGKGPPGTRLKFPQVSADLSVRWCSAYLKADPSSMALANQPDRFNHKRILFLTGERREESAARAKYQEFAIHRNDARKGKLGRHIDHWRMVIDWPEAQIWNIIQRWGIVPHPCYRIGFARCSCLTCIFASDAQMATLWEIAQEYVQMQAKYETMFGTTVHRTRSVMERVFRGVPYEAVAPEMVELAMNRQYEGPVWVPPSEWRLPAGAFGEDKAGPT